MNRIKTDVLVIGAGPGGYAAAFSASDHGSQVLLVDISDSLGGVCLNRGCIPSKALLHITKLLTDAKEASSHGVTFSEPTIDLDAMRSWKNDVIKTLSSGIQGLAKKRGVDVVHGRAHFEDSETVRVETSNGQQFITFNSCIIAVGSTPALPGAFDLGNKRIMTSTEALELEDIPQSLLVVGGGYIGMELGLVYSALGSKVDLVEAFDGILMGADRDLVRPVMATAKKRFHSIRLKTKVEKMSTSGKTIKVTMSCDGKRSQETYDKVLVSIGRSPNTVDLGLVNADITCDAKGFIQVNANQQTSVSNIYAIGDVAGGTLLAHKASKEARIAVDTIMGGQSVFKDVIIPAVVFTQPEVAWCGVTEMEAKDKGLNVAVAKFPWAASGRALTLNSTDGLTKMIIDPETDRILGVGIVGDHAGDLISEAVLAVEMGATAKDLALTVHPHPTLSETLMECAEVYYGHCSHVYSPRKQTVEV